jgi:hypothetical protein
VADLRGAASIAVALLLCRAAVSDVVSSSPLPSPLPFVYGNVSRYHPLPMAKHSSHILELARNGAEHRYRGLKTEIASLVKIFPHLRSMGLQSVQQCRMLWRREESDAGGNVPRCRLLRAKRSAFA